MRFRAEFDMYESDCRCCPCADRYSRHVVGCNLSDFAVEGILVPGSDGYPTYAFPIPVDCPLTVATGVQDE